MDPTQIDYVLGGNVIQEVKTSNVAREAAMAAGRGVGLIYYMDVWGVYVCVAVGVSLWACA